MKQKINYKKILTLFSTIFLLTSATSFISFAATPSPTEIETAIEDGIEWLVGMQNTDGSWGTSSYVDAKTGLSLIKLADYAYEEGYDSPFNESYLYSENVTAGWDYLLASAINTSIHEQIAGDPDSNGNGFGIYWFNGNLHYSVYCAGICLMALVATGTPDRVATGYDFDEDGSNDTFFEIAQDVTDWLAFAQTDPASVYRGGWNYDASDNLSTRADNSITGYATLGLAAAESSAALPGATPFECNIPSFVKTELDYWTAYIQSPDGGSGYTAPGSSNMYRTGNLIFELTMMGDGPGDTQFDNAIDYIEANWANSVSHTGWNISSGTADYQAMFTLMKGFVYSGITTIDLTGIGGDANHDWFMEFATVLVDQQNPDGSWPSSNWDDGQRILSTCWALLVLEKISPEQPNTFSVSKDFRHTNVNFNPIEHIEFYLEDFESDCPPTDWIIHDSPSELNGDTWACNTTPNLPTMLDLGGVSGTFMEFDDDDYGSSSLNPSEELITSSIDCSMFKNIYLDFDGDFEDMAGGGIFWVNISTDGGSTWTEVFFETYDVDPGGWDNHTGFPISLSPYADGESNLKIKFTYSDVFDDQGTIGQSSYGWGVTLDNIRLSGDCEMPAILGDLIDYDETEEHYLMDLVVKKNGKVSSTNPGQLYAVINMSGPINNVTVNDNFDYEFDVNPAKVGGGVTILLIDPDGYATVITYESGVTAEVDNVNNWVNISIELDEQLPSGWNLMIYIKFKTAMKHQKVLSPFNYAFNNTAYVYLNDIDKENEPTIVTADILLTPKR